MSASAWLAAAVLCEVIATSALKASDGFTRSGPTSVVVLGYASAFFSLSHALRDMPIGTAYAIWSGAGIVLVTIMGLVMYGQRPDALGLFAMALIVVGAAVLNLRA